MKNFQRQASTLATNHIWSRKRRWNQTIKIPKTCASTNRTHNASLLIKSRDAKVNWSKASSSETSKFIFSQLNKYACRFKSYLPKFYCYVLQLNIGALQWWKKFSFHLEIILLEKARSSFKIQDTDIGKSHW